MRTAAAAGGPTQKRQVVQIADYARAQGSGTGNAGNSSHPYLKSTSRQGCGCPLTAMGPSGSFASFMPCPFHTSRACLQLSGMLALEVSSVARSECCTHLPANDAASVQAYATLLLSWCRRVVIIYDEVALLSSHNLRGHHTLPISIHCQLIHCIYQASTTPNNTVSCSAMISTTVLQLQRNSLHEKSMQ